MVCDVEVYNQDQLMRPIPTTSNKLLEDRVTPAKGNYFLVLTVLYKRRRYSFPNSAAAKMFLREGTSTH
jgi:hypothetical protein